MKLAAIWRLALAAGIALGATAASAADTNPSDGNSLYENCQSKDVAILISCHQYIIGVVDGIQIAEPTDRPAFTIPTGVKGTQIRDIVMRYLTDNPDKRHWPSSVLIWNALVKIFPPAPPPSLSP